MGELIEINVKVQLVSHAAGVADGNTAERIFDQPGEIVNLVVLPVGSNVKYLPVNDLLVGRYNRQYGRNEIFDMNKGPPLAAVAIDVDMLVLERVERHDIDGQIEPHPTFREPVDRCVSHDGHAKVLVGEGQHVFLGGEL